jgi:phosphatidylserine/phosphatidylglycerophosphate/cardiolipin synthase-like enzyme
MVSAEMLSSWFLRASERGNAATEIDRRHASGDAWTTANHVRVHVDGANYFARLYEELCSTGPGVWIHFTDWRGDPDERLAGPGTEIARVLAERARAGVHVRGLVWRSHSDKAHFSETENLHLVETVNEAGGEVLLDERVRRAGSHHQKLFLVRYPDDPARDVAFIGGIDLCHGRHDDHRHHGDPQAIELDDRYGPNPAWHDIQAEVRGPAVADLAWTFRERWEDPTPLDHRNPWRKYVMRIAREPRRPDPLPPMPDDPPPAGAHAVQVLRTYPARRPPFPFAPDGERSVARAYIKAFARARSLIYVEDQYLWSAPAAAALASALQREPSLRMVVLVPRHPDRDGRFSGPPYRIGQHRAFRRVMAAGPGRVAVFDLENESSLPVYVHAKVCIVDDQWMVVGSDNLNQRSWTNDSELSIAVVDEHADLPGATRVRLWREHTQAEVPDDVLADPARGFDALEASAARLDAWHASGRRGARPPGRLRRHEPEPVPLWTRPWAVPLYRTFVDPDGRPRAMRQAGRF